MRVYEKTEKVKSPLAVTELYEMMIDGLAPRAPN